MATKRYLVQWEMEIDAASARDTAQQAWEHMRALGSTANVFYVTNDSGDTERVDLKESPDTAARARTRDTTPRARKSKHLWEQRNPERARAASRERSRRYVERHGEAYKRHRTDYMREYKRRKRAAEKQAGGQSKPKPKHIDEKERLARKRAAAREHTRRYVERHGEAYKRHKAEYMREYMRRKRAAEKQGDDPSSRSNANHAKYRND